MSMTDAELLMLSPFLLAFIIPAACIVGLSLAEKWRADDDSLFNK